MSSVARAIFPSVRRALVAGALPVAAANVLMVLASGCSSAPTTDDGQSSASTSAVAAISNLCKAATDEVLNNCPGTSAQQWSTDEGVVSGVVSCTGCVASIPTSTVGGAVLALVACTDCLKEIAQADACAAALSHLAECAGPCEKSPNGSNVCGGPYGNDFYQCQNGYPVREGACGTHQFCDPRKSFSWGTINPPQCGDCDNDHGQAPSSSYHAGQGYCMPHSGNAPGWHECISNGNAGGGGHWVFLPQLNAQNHCNPAPPPPPPPPAPKCSSQEMTDSEYGGRFFWTCDLNGDGGRYTCAANGNKSTSACGAGTRCTSGGVGWDDYCAAPPNQCTAQETYASQYRGQSFWTCDLNGDGNVFKCDASGVKSKQSCIHGCVSSPAGTDDLCVNSCPNCQ